jgi:hypothetical protein
VGVKCGRGGSVLFSIDKLGPRPIIRGTKNNGDKKMIEYKVKVFNEGTKEWYLNNKLHREDGPAMEYADGSKSWYLNGIELSEADFIELSVEACDELKKYLKTLDPRAKACNEV